MENKMLTLDELNEVTNAIDDSKENWEKLKSNPSLFQRSVNAIKWLNSAREKLKGMI